MRVYGTFPNTQTPKQPIILISLSDFLSIFVGLWFQVVCGQWSVFPTPKLNARPLKTSDGTYVICSAWSSPQLVRKVRFRIKNPILLVVRTTELTWQIPMKNQFHITIFMFHILSDCFEGIPYNTHGCPVHHS